MYNDLQWKHSNLRKYCAPLLWRGKCCRLLLLMRVFFSLQNEIFRFRAAALHIGTVISAIFSLVAINHAISYEDMCSEPFVIEPFVNSSVMSTWVKYMLWNDWLDICMVFVSYWICWPILRGAGRRTRFGPRRKIPSKKAGNIRAECCGSGFVWAIVFRMFHAQSTLLPQSFVYVRIIS